MLKLTKTGIGLLTKQYRSVLKKCLLFNLGLFIVALISGSLISGNAFAERLGNNEEIWTYGSFYIRIAPVTAELDVVATYSGHTYKTDIMESHINFYIDDVLKTSLSTGLFKLNGSLAATGIDFASNVTAGTTDASHLTTTGAVNQLLNNYYYTFRVDERTEVIEFASFFQKDFSTLQKVDLQSKNPTHLGAFTKCDEVCPRPSERFASSLSQEQMFKNDASVDAGTFSICSLQIENVNEKLSNVFEA